MMLGARRPVIYAGGGVILGGASDKLVEPDQALNFPLTNTLMGLGAYPGSDRQCLGMLGMHGSYKLDMAISLGPDTGYRCTFLMIVSSCYLKFCPESFILISTLPPQFPRPVDVDVPIVGPVDSVRKEMLSLIGTRQSRSRMKALARLVGTIEEWKAFHGGRYAVEDGGKSNLNG